MEEPTSDKDLSFWLALMRTPTRENTTLNNLLRKFKSPEAIFHADSKELSTCNLSQKVISYLLNPDWEKIQPDLDWLARSGNYLITIADRDYPSFLKQIDDPPLAIYVSGNKDILNTLQIGIVGSRKPTHYGRRISREFAAQLCAHGITITSGLALGIDSCAHSGALDCHGKTIAVLGNGLDYIYPSGSRKLAASILEAGAIVSEFPIGYRPIPANFPRRNRIISGLSAGVMVVEAATKSGSLITANYALNQGREVFAVPGSVYNPLAHGCHCLIRDGAKLTHTVTDILEEIGALANCINLTSHNLQIQPREINILDADSKLLLDNIGYQATTIDDLVELTTFPVHKLTTLLLQLELTGLVEALPGGNFMRR